MATTELKLSVLNEDEQNELFGDKKARWFQIAARNQTIFELEQNRTARIAVVQPTGCGKTLSSGLILISPDVKKAIIGNEDRPLRVLFVAHMHRLLSQAERAFASEQSIRVIDSSNLKESHMIKNNIPHHAKLSKPHAEIYYQSAFSAIPDELEFDLVIIDECHHEAMSTIQYKLDIMGGFPIIGLTATFNRADGCIIKFDAVINPITREEAVAQGFLAETSIYSIVDVPTKDKTVIISKVLEQYAHLMGQTMVFVRTKKEVGVITQVLQDMGYLAVGLLNQSTKELDKILEAFSEGKIEFIVSCKRIGEGIDVKNCSDVVCGRQYNSYTELNQNIGRAARPDGGTDGEAVCRVWELVNPLSSSNLDTTVIVGTPIQHLLISQEKGKWVEREFDYITHATNKQLGIEHGIRINHAA
ncbi:MAG: DEAD/DEAH box helicase [Nitrososphaeraceae archaeon]